MEIKKSLFNACPCCGMDTIDELGNYEICDVCDWEDDPVQSQNPDYFGGANHTSLNEARQKWDLNKQK